MKSIFSIVLVLLSIAAFAIDSSAGQYRITLHTDPAVLQVGKAKLLITLADQGGKPVDHASIKVLAQMPGMPMGERETVASPSGKPGAYSTQAVFGMAGSYDIRISVDGALGAGQTTMTVSTGEEAGASRAPIGGIVVVLLIIAATVGVLRQTKKTGQSIRLAEVFNRQVAWSLGLLVIAGAVAVWTINTKRRPGAMTPLEAQVMDMNAPAPEGSLPVRLAKVEIRPFEATVTYSGQAVGYVEQDVVSRASGAIVWMPFYVGDRVTKGQILARLDTTQIDPAVGEKKAQSAAASQGVDIAQSDYRRALAEVAEAEAEQAIREGAIDEAASMVTASKEAEVAAEANLRMEQSSVVDARSQVASAEADRGYWTQELARNEQMYAKGAVSKDELQKAQASASESAAKLRQAAAGVDAAIASVEAARAAVSKSAADVVSAQNKLREIRAEHHAHMAHVAAARAAADTAKRRIGQAGSEAEVARASLVGATTQRDHAELRSEIDGFITARSINPGVVVSPGQTVLKLAQVSPIRLQANVPEADLARIQLGAKVKVRRRESSEAPVEVTVTSVSPSVDSATRTGVVEALYPNADGRFKPGQFVSMEISVGTSGVATVIPTDAVQTDEGRSFVWLADVGTDNRFAVSQRDVKLGDREGDFVKVESGLNGGEMVVSMPPQGLEAGMNVTAETPQTGTAKTDQTIEITAAGYSPPSVYVPAGKPFRVTFIRRDDKTCGTEVIFPDLKIRRTLPLNQPVTIDIPAQPAGKELNFTCPMNMLNGKAVAR